MNSNEIRDLFNRIAPVYDQLNRSLSLGQHKIWKLMTVKWSGAKPGDRCLDVCCGSGDIALLLAERVGQMGAVTGVDFAVEQLAIAGQRNPAITWVEGDALALPFADASFDAVTMGYGLRNVTDIPQALKELYRVLKPGATAAVLDFNHTQNPLVKAFQNWYLEAIVVSTATRFGMTDEYAYIAPSLERFPTGETQVNLAKQVGFSTVTHYPIAGGTMGVLVAQK
ncbi:MAG TPA: bifunctional demethylmenaquinone methyltransferase/2-methoxy-6-polyprenyl-1,4-benzoquinol methylase UbiE [Leptolyngbyaceae cyanobacterium M33_DOE_097]|uniref:2-phytyl-1,4-naphtoquinone methyltransferase n=1 Tax=Oscillatoriales cyanobacterium SpSt-418 TaxID=2282169 RepID=A0A7C3KFV5_9CYAN|nr:bifunctional demethylmenaquinone methyltransferase/2-methoxy-6-polyprenyl-1,4-benzoquinol methylase UbiE [Leptolyngbyaceae cyanobacterium M33_DOE_097]